MPHATAARSNRIARRFCRGDRLPLQRLPEAARELQRVLSAPRADLVVRGEDAAGLVSIVDAAAVGPFVALSARGWQRKSPARALALSVGLIDGPTGKQIHQEHTGAVKTTTGDALPVVAV